MPNPVRALTALALAAVLPLAASADPLPSWNEGEAKSRILAFVAAVTDPASEQYLPPEARIATFDNDGALWAEQPLYFQLVFALDRVRAQAGAHPEWKDDPTFAAVLGDDPKALESLHLEDVIKLVAASHAGMTDAEFAASAEAWLGDAKHPRFGVPYASLVYQPTLELLSFLRDSGFQTWICSGGGIDFVRAFAEETYGIPPEQVIGSGIAKEFRFESGAASFARLPKLLEPVNDKEGKPVWIRRQIGRRPALAFGNSDGDLAMLRYATSGTGTSLGILLHHDDAEREWAYDRESHVGRLSEGLDVAKDSGWLLVSMKDDFARVFPAH
ncbi:MAG: haloacid dehalogenase-like hydrolase [Myxococcales bacterium]|nr:haloacid dehalogenase-like hydrolase [Myxococcales bacterium]